MKKFIGGKGKNHPMWKGGRFIDGYGYVLVYKPNHPCCNARGQVREHRLVMEKKIGRYLSGIELVHHINGIKTDNRIKNLLLLDKKEHDRIEHLGSKNFMFGKKHSEETKKRMTKSQKDRWLKIKNNK